MKKLEIFFLLSGLFIFNVQAETLKGSGDASFSVKATGHTVHGTAELLPFDVVVTPAGDDKLLSFKVHVDVLTLDTDKKKRDKELYHFLHAEEHPQIHGEAKNISLASLTQESEEPITIPFSFNLVGETVEREATLISIEETDEALDLVVAFDLLQTEHGLKPIRKFGLLTVKDLVRVEVHFILAH